MIKSLNSPSMCVVFVCVCFSKRHDDGARDDGGSDLSRRLAHVAALGSHILFIDVTVCLFEACCVAVSSSSSAQIAMSYIPLATTDQRIVEEHTDPPPPPPPPPNGTDSMPSSSLVAAAAAMLVNDAPSGTKHVFVFVVRVCCFTCRFNSGDNDDDDALLVSQRGMLSTCFTDRVSMTTTVRLSVRRSPCVRALRHAQSNQQTPPTAAQTATTSDGAQRHRSRRLRDRMC
jgi:hypothetical protein